MSQKSLIFEDVKIQKVVMDPSGFEPEASALQGQRSTVELRAPGRAKILNLRMISFKYKKKKRR